MPNNDFLAAILAVYGNRLLDRKTMKLLKRTWKQNPNLIYNAAKLKHGANMDKFQHDYDMYHKFGAMLEPRIPLNPGVSVPDKLESNGPSARDLIEQRLNSGDMSMFSDFGMAFNEAKKRKQSEFNWRETEANPSGRFNTKTLEEVKKEKYMSPMNPNSQSLASLAARPDLSIRGIGNPSEGSFSESPKRELHLMERPLAETKTRLNIPSQSDRAGQTFVTYSGNAEMPDGSFRNTSRVMLYNDGKFNTIGKQGWMWSNKDQYGNKVTNPRWEPTGGKVTVRYQQQGGTMGNQEELQKAFMAFLIEDAAAQGMQIQSEQDLQAYAQQLGEEGLKAKYQEFMQKMQGGVKAKLGAKLDYIRKIKGLCPEGEELVYMKQGGRVCPVCQKKAEKAQGGKKLPKKNAIADFKEKRKQVNPNDTVNTKFGPRDLNGNTKYKKYDTNKENYDFETRKRVQEKDEKSGKKIFGSACGSKLKKK